MIGAGISMRFSFRRTKRFDRTIKHLQKRYPRLKVDLIPIFASIENDPAIGVVIPKDYNIRKLRVPSSDMQKGKSGGFRLLYKLSTDEEDLKATLLYIYAKSDQTDVSTLFLETLSDDIDEYPDNP
jgi:mRNA-degrading endonuclease RelE of RelBE toxin-antitoxin system